MSSRNLLDIVDGEKLKLLVDSFCRSIDITAAITDVDGKNLIGANWQQTCKNFHWVHPETSPVCLETRSSLMSQIHAGKKFAIHQCRNGLTEAASPIIVHGQHVGYVVIGQFHLKSPNIEFFRHKAIKLGFDQAVYLESINKAPILSRERVQIILKHLNTLAEMLGDMGEKALERATEALHRSEATLKSIFRAIPVGICLIQDRTLQSANERLSEITGYNADALLGRPTCFLYESQEEFERVGIALYKDLWTKGASYIEARFRRPDGSIRDVFMHSAPVQFDDPSAGVVVAVQDITERKQLERQYLHAQRLESIGTLTSGIAHDINNILAPIVMGTEALQAEIQNEECQSILSMMEESAQRGVDTVKQLLTFARGGNSQKGPVQPRLLLKEIERLLLKTFPKNIHVYSDYESCTSTVQADPSQLHQVLMNLCVNARDAMPEGGALFLTLENLILTEDQCNIHPCTHPGPYVVFNVTDNGSGIAPEILEQIFDPFFTTKPHGKGTGLGLSTVMGIVKKHDGFVLVESALGKGSSFIVYLPASAAETGDIKTKKQNKPLNGNGELVLVVDDEPSILHITQIILQRNNYRILTASNASDALDLFDNNRSQVRLVLTDMMMPFGDGQSLITALRQRIPLLPVIAMSGLSAQSTQAAIIKNGANAFLQKPFLSDSLLTIVGNTLKNTPSTPIKEG